MNKQKTKLKQTEIGMIPEDWEVKELANLCNEITDGSHFSPKKDNKGEFFIATVKNFSEYGFDMPSCKKISEENFRDLIKNGCVPEKGDVLLSKDGTMGIVYVSRGENIALLSSIAILKPKEIIDSYFLSYFLKDKRTQNNITFNFSSGSALPRIVLKDLKKLPIVFPKNRREQVAIASVLSKLDAKIELNQQMNKTLEAIGKAIFKHWFIGFEFLNEEGKPYKSSGGEMVYNEELGKEIPKGWKLKTINDVVTVKGGSTPSTENPEYWENGKINWCTPKDLSELKSTVLLDTERKITESGLSTISSGLLPTGTVLLSSRAPIGYLAISEIPVSINQGFIAIVCNKEISKYFMLLWLMHNMDKIESRAHGTTFQEINKASFRNISILVPAPDILNNYDKLMHALYSKIVKNEKEINILSHLRDSLLPKLMSGKIRVPVEAE